MAEIKIEWHIEGLSPEGAWCLLGKLGTEGDHLAHRDSVVRMLREKGIDRYRSVRLAKYVTTIEIIGQDIAV